MGIPRTGAGVKAVFGLDGTKQTDQGLELKGAVSEGVVEVGDQFLIPVRRGFDRTDNVATVTAIRKKAPLKSRQTPLEQALPDQAVLVTVSGINGTPAVAGFLKDVGPATTLSGPEVAYSADPKVSQAVNDFKNQYNDFFAGRGELTCVTQEMYHLLHQQKRRLDALGLTMTAERRKDSDVGVVPIRSRSYDSKRYHVTEAWEPLDCVRAYRQQGRVIFTDSDWRTAEYLILDAKRTGSGDVVCPNCGASGTRDELMAGCPYCGTQFTIRDLGNRVTGYAAKPIRGLGRTITQGASQLEYGFQRRQHTLRPKALRKACPGFSVEAFHNGLRNKLYGIVFAASEAEASRFTADDLSMAPFVAAYSNVVDMTLEDVAIQSVNAGDELVAVTLDLDLELLRLQRKMGWDRERATVTLSRRVGVPQREAFEPTIMRCDGCGVTVSVLDGQWCPYCGTRIDLLSQDWLITGFDRNSAPKRPSIFD